MTHKITLPELIELLARKVGCTKRDSENFLRELMALMTETISSGESLRINGLGAFKLTWVEDRASVNVHTGQPQLIPGHYKLTFTPTKQVREAVNEPFACFCVEVIDDDAPLVTGVVDNPDIVDEMADEEEDTTQPIVSEVTQPVAEEEKPIVKEEQPMAEVALPHNLQPTEESQNSDEIGDKEVVTTPEDIAEDIHEVIAEEVPEVVAEDTPITKDAPEIEETPEVEDAPIAANIADEKDTPIATNTPHVAPSTPHDVTDEEEDEEEPHRSRWWIGVAVAAVVVLLAGAGAYIFLLSDSKSASPEVADTDYIADNQGNATITQPIDEEVARVVGDSTVIDGNGSVDNAESAHAEAEKTPDELAISSDRPHKEPTPNMAVSADDNSVTETITSGVFLTTLSRRHYGDKAFWVYIYEENRATIANPDNIAVGTVVVIPPAEKYGINAADSASIRKALDMADVIKGKNKR